MTYLTLLSHDSSTCFFMKQPVHLVIQVLVNRLKFILLSYFWHWTNRLSRGFSLEKFTPKEIAFRKQHTHNAVTHISKLSPTSYRVKKSLFDKNMADSRWNCFCVTPSYYGNTAWCLFRVQNGQNNYEKRSFRAATIFFITTDIDILLSALLIYLGLQIDK